MPALSHQAKLLQGLLTRETAYAGPIFVDIDLSARCNLHCLGCPYHSPYLESALREDWSSAYISFDLLERLCRDLAAMKTQSVIFQGSGEPLLHPRIVDAISLFKQAGMQVVLLTNGTLLDERLIRAFIEARLDILKVSLWATSPEQYHQNYPGSPVAYLDKAQKSLKLMARIKAERKSKYPAVLVHHIINRFNHQTLDDVLNVALTTGCNGVTFAPLANLGHGLTPFLLSAEEEAIARSSLNRMRKRMDALGLQHNISQALLRYEMGEAVWEKTPCYIAWYHARIRVDGSIDPCGRCDSSFGNLQQNTFRETWNNDAIRAFRRQVLTRAGLAAIGKDCDCGYCCFVAENFRVHRIFRLFAPFAVRSREPRAGEASV